MIREYRTVEEIASPLMIVRMVDGVTYDELVEVELHDGSVRRGQVLEVNGDTAVVQPSLTALTSAVRSAQRVEP